MENSKINRIIITGGGTGGHLIPSFAIADALIKKAQNLEIRFIGSKNGIESRLYKKRNEKYYLLNIKGIKRSFHPIDILKNIFIFPAICFVSIVKVIKIYTRFKPNLIIGTGGYSSAIPLFVARLKNIKIIIQEQNAIPGLVNKLFLKKAYKVCFGFKPEKMANNFLDTGNPTFLYENSKNFKNTVFDSNNKFTIFIIGGSQGSVPINKHFIKNYKFYLDMGIRLIWQCGKNNISSLKDIIQNEDIHLFGFINPLDMPYYYSKADLVISRAGALTLSELSNFHVASILIPFPSSANNHQFHNAQYFHLKGAAQIVEQRELVEGILESKVQKIINNIEIVRLMREKIKKIAKPDAAKMIASEVLKIC